MLSLSAPYPSATPFDEHIRRNATRDPLRRANIQCQKANAQWSGALLVISIFRTNAVATAVSMDNPLGSRLCQVVNQFWTPSCAIRHGNPVPRDRQGTFPQGMKHSDTFVTTSLATLRRLSIFSIDTMRVSTRFLECSFINVQGVAFWPPQLKFRIK